MATTAASGAPARRGGAKKAAATTTAARMSSAVIEPCEKYDREGTCPYGRRCCYLHGGADDYARAFARRNARFGGQTARDAKARETPTDAAADSAADAAQPPPQPAPASPPVRNGRLEVNMPVRAVNAPHARTQAAAAAPAPADPTNDAADAVVTLEACRDCRESLRPTLPCNTCGARVCIRCVYACDGCAMGNIYNNPFGHPTPLEIKERSSAWCGLHNDSHYYECNWCGRRACPRCLARTSDMHALCETQYDALARLAT
jgi:hypothetical protein